MALSERFGIGPDFFVGVQGQAFEASASSTVANVDITSAIPGDDLTNSVVIPVPAGIELGVTTTRVIVWSLDVIVGDFAGAWTVDVKRIHGADTDTVYSNPGPPVSGHISSGTDSNTYPDTNNETWQLHLTNPGGPGGVNPTVRLSVSSYTVTWTPNITVTGVAMHKNNIDNRRIGTVSVIFNGNTYELRIVFHDETLEQKTLTGHNKKRTNA